MTHPLLLYSTTTKTPTILYKTTTKSTTILYNGSKTQYMLANCGCRWKKLLVDYEQLEMGTSKHNKPNGQQITYRFQEDNVISE
jgi:hypothetical protein